MNAEKARRAAQRPDRPGEKCGAEAGAYRPVVDRNACEGKRDCVEVCPYDVFEVRQIDEEDFSSLSFLGKLKSRDMAVGISLVGTRNISPSGSGTSWFFTTI